MSIQGLVNAGMDNAPPKTKEIPKTIQNNASSEEKTDQNAQTQAKQSESTMSGMKQFTDAIAESMNMDMSSARVSFSKDTNTGDIVIRVIDSETDEVIKQIPSKEVIELRKRLGDLQGLLLDRKV